MIVIVGGHSRNIGKTSVVCSIIRDLPEFRWTAIKVTQFGHGLCSRDGKPCECESPLHPIAVTEERRGVAVEDRRHPPDSARFLLAGAERAFWVRTPVGRIDEVISRLHTMIAEAPNVIVESNSLLRFLKPDFCAMVVDGSILDFKPTCRQFMDRADALVPTSTAPLRWPDVPDSVISGLPQYRALAPHYSSPALAAAIRAASTQPVLPSIATSSTSPITRSPNA